MKPSTSTDNSQLVALSRGKACLMCRERKRRCDRAKPVCSSCVKVKKSHLCVYDDGTQDQVQVQSHYDRVQQERALKDRVEELEDLIRKAQDQLSIAPSRNNRGTLSILLPASMLDDRRQLSAGTPAPPISAGAIHRRPKPAIPPPVKEPAVDWWKLHEEIPPLVRNLMIDLFIRYGWQFGMDLNVARLRTALELPSGHRDALHPALLHAVLLNGCLYAELPLRRYEKVFLQRTRYYLNQSLLAGQKLFDFLCASALLGNYFYVRGRLREGYLHTSAASAFALACGLHTIGSLCLDSQIPNPLIPPCGSVAELGDRINLFWSLFSSDHTGSLFVAWPRTISDKGVSTLWPSPSADYESGRALLQPPGSLEMLSDPVSLRSIREDNFQTLRQKGILILSRATVVSARARLSGADDLAIRNDVRAICEVTLAFANSLPEFRVREIDRDYPDIALSVLAIGFTAAHSAVIQSHGIIARTEPGAREEQLKAVKKAMLIARKVEQMERSRLPIFITWALTPVHVFLTREKARLQKLGREEELAAVRQDLQVLQSIFTRIGELFPTAAHIVDELSPELQAEIARLAT
ncbi:hypothetical protein BOTBODRAFT_25682 [Botryobasidium botryosum FD-172 SS1]|uniref:Zn(2)-C6 fungal-type domain-containing protein n=1 Tax=Botryobasidium botryosum (strain FD-172 SS1) TaxID=930990 RepID=A0A067N065_BOTB1|nr:hypothetical protein BOTBODRAFT_25682 [Botryobasidium botryosum FD-172 SS1]